MSRILPVSTINTRSGAAALARLRLRRAFGIIGSICSSDDDMTAAILYGTLGCHLCEEAALLLRPLVEDGRLSVSEVDIADDEQLLERYGVRIPVLRLQSGRELGWPFDHSAVLELLRAG